MYLNEINYNNIINKLNIISFMQDLGSGLHHKHYSLNDIGCSSCSTTFPHKYRSAPRDLTPTASGLRTCICSRVPLAHSVASRT